MVEPAIDDLTHALPNHDRTRRGILRLAAGAGAGATSLAFAAEALGKKKRKKKKCKKPQPITLQTAIISCPGPSTTEFTNSRRFAQTFSATQTGALTTASVELTQAPAGSDFNFEIRTDDGNGVPTSEVLASANVVDVPLLNGSHLTLTVAFNPSASVVQGEAYAVVFTGTPFSDGYDISTRVGDDRAGQMFIDPSANGAFIPDAVTDLVFSVSLTSTG